MNDIENFIVFVSNTNTAPVITSIAPSTAIEGHVITSYSIHYTKLYEGEIHLKNNFPDSALIYLNKSNAIAAEYGEDYLLSENYGLLSEIYVLKSDYNKAFTCLKQSREINDSLSSLETVQLVEELEIKYNVKQKDP